MEQEERWKKSSAEWKKRISQYDNLMNMSCIDEKYNNDLLLDALQDLFSESVNTNTKMELLLFLQQQVVILIEDVDSAEQVFGSLLNIFNYLGNHLIMLKSQVLITLTTICTTFNMEELAVCSDFITILIDTISKINSGHPLLIRTCSDCLYMIEDTYHYLKCTCQHITTEQQPTVLKLFRHCPLSCAQWKVQGSLQEHVQTILATATEERSFASFSHLILLADIVNHLSTRLRSMEDNTELISERFDIGKCLSYIIKQMNTVSPTCLLQLIPKVFPCLEGGKIPKLVLGSLLDYCGQSWNLLLVYASLRIQRNYSSFMQFDETWTVSMILKLLLLKDLPQLYVHQRSFVQYWLQNYIQHLSSGLLQNEACSLAFPLLQPNSFDALDLFIKKLDCIISISQTASIKIPLEQQSDIIRCLINHSKYARHVEDISTLFHGFFCLYKYCDENTKDSIVRFVEEITVDSLQLVSNTVDFCDNIETYCERTSSNKLLRNITQHLFRLNLSDLVRYLSNYLTLLERVAAVKDICPLIVIEKLKQVSRTSFLRDCSWENGNILLSICRNILRNAATAQIRYDVAGLLWNIHQTFQNTNICDRALFYYLIAGNVSPKYHEQVFLSSNDQYKKENQHVKETTPVIIHGPSNITMLQSPFLLFEKLNNAGNDLINENILNIEPNQDIIEIYHSSLSSTSFNKSIKYEFCLKFDKTVESKFNKIFALNIDVSTNSNFQPVPGVCCAYLQKDFNESIATKGQDFLMRFTPITPRPANFDVSVSFMDEDNQTYMIELKTLQLKFHDLFLPLSKIENQENIVLFDALWTYMERNQKSIEKPECKCALSIKCITEASLQNFTTSLRTMKIEGSTNYFGIYLPPSTHVLFRFTSLDDEEKKTIQIATDDFLILELIHQYLNTFVQSE